MSIIRIVDIETTGMEPPAQVCELGYCDYDTDTREIATPHSCLYAVDAMPPDVRAVHHITMKMLDGRDPFDPAHAMVGGPWGLAAHNAKFEAQWLGDVKICTYKAALRVWPDASSHGNFALFYWLEDAGKIDVANFDSALAQPSHRAGPDAYVTAHILKALLASGVTGKEMVAWTKEPAPLPRCPIGKFRGKPWDDVEEGFLGWMLKQADMEADLKWNAQREIDRRNA